MFQEDRNKEFVGRRTVNGQVLWLLGDACVFALALFKGVEYSLLHMEGLVSRAGLGAGLGLMLGALAALRWSWARRSGARMWPGLAVEWAAAGGACLALARLSLIQNKAQSFAWLPLEWHKLLDNHWLLVRVTPTFALALAALVVLGVWLFVGRRRGWLLFGTAAAVVLTYYQCTIMAKQGTLGVYLVMYVFPLLLVGIAAAARCARMGARTLVLAAASLILLWHYIGWAPVIRDKSFEKMPGVERIYPLQGQAPEFPLAFFRDFQVDPQGQFLYTAYGPTSGIVRLDVQTGAVRVLRTHAELVRYIDLVPERNTFFALDWMNADMLTLGMDTMQIQERENVYFEKQQLYVPVFYIEDGPRMLATYSERPGVAEFSLYPLKLKRWINLREQGVTGFRSGVWKAALDPAANKLFVEAGMVNLRDEFLLLRIDLDTFTIDGAAVLPQGGLELTVVPRARRIIATSFFSDRLYEFDMDTMKRTRVLRGPRSCRNLVYDANRDLLIGTGFLDGELRVIDFKSGNTITRAAVGNKAASLYITPDSADLYLGSSWGVFRVRLNEFLAKASSQH
jgi:hypothetical protein